MADSLRTVIVTTLAIGGLLTGVLVLRESHHAPEWLRAPAEEPSAGTNAGGGPVVPALPPPQGPTPAVTVPPPPPPEVASSESAPPGAASVAGAPPQPVASASAGRARKPGGPAAAQPGEPEVVELPQDFRYSPQGPGNLTFPVGPATASTSTGQAR